MVNILDALLNYAEMDDRDMSEIYSSSNRINRVGDRLEYFTMDLFCGSFDIETKDEKEKKYSKHFSWLGNKNHPPDFMIENGEAFEVKKTTSKAGSIQLNSSHPHQKLKSSNERITNSCQKCEDHLGGWNEKELVYILGRVPRGEDNLDFIWMVYGDCWAAPEQVYENLSNKLSKKTSQAVGELDYGDLSSQTNEIGKVHDADPLGRTKLRIRGMWTMSHPANYFSQHIENYKHKIEEKQPLFAVMKKSKYQEIPEDKIKAIEEQENIKYQEIQAPDPANPANRINALIFEIED
ncbi:NgoPII family restriction endonuclease [Candidatus Nanohalobium constans]|uniref:NgoPII family restriction endonuclease n=1 Tax=Candidatus Nanohalobium constans TaxID=2565781 RepID=A0A5Q0UJ82_9ARCH|nr:NgoPII family restriction endonuclease [Candidatus Nanohalobium constans]QGA80889.1 NgoPII family restriction endonuclease [Candidatus Nanohalobium constans]